MATISLTKELISKLKHINIDSLKTGKYNFPDFIIIGPQRTGTTWLHHNLIKHPQIFMPSQKELFFFCNLIDKEANRHYYSDRLEWYSDKFASFNIENLVNFLKMNVKNVVINRKPEGTLCRFRHYLGNNVIKGEATASYAAMDESLIRELICLKPDIKIIMFIRHPYDRAWSHAKKDLVRESSRSFEDVTLEEFKEFFSSDYQVRCGRYTDIIEQWQKFTKKEQLFVGVFDDIKKAPKNVLKDVFSFLGVSVNENYIEDQLSATVINPTGKQPIPDAHKEILKNLFAEEIGKMNSRFGLDWSAD